MNYSFIGNLAERLAFSSEKNKIPRKSMMSPRQCKAARALLELTQQALADQSGLGVATVVEYENGRRHATRSTLMLIRTTLERLGVTFIDGEQIGVMMDATQALAEES